MFTPQRKSAVYDVWLHHGRELYRVYTWILAAAVPMVIHFGFVDLSSSANAAWYSQTGPYTFGTICPSKSLVLSSDTFGQTYETPAFAITMSRWSIPSSAVSFLTASEADVSTEASTLTTMSRLPGPVGSSERALDVGWEGSRLAAITMWSGFARKISMSPLPVVVILVSVYGSRQEDVQEGNIFGNQAHTQTSVCTADEDDSWSHDG